MNKKTTVLLVGVVLALGFVLEFLFYYLILAESEALQRGWLWLSLGLAPFLLGLLVYVILQRFQELTEEEKDDLSQY